MATTFSEKFKLPRATKTGPNGMTNPGLPKVEGQQKGYSGTVPATAQQFQFLTALTPRGDDYYGPAARVHATATNRDLSNRLNSAAGKMAMTRKQLAINEKTNSGMSNVKSTQFNYTTDYYQLPKPATAILPTFGTNEIILAVLVGLGIYMVLFKR